MAKKIRLSCIYYLLVLGMLIVFAKDFMNKGLDHLFPIVSSYYKQEHITTSWMASGFNHLYPNLYVEATREAVARRKDEFQIKSIKPVELLTMMGLENGSVVQTDIQVTPIPSKDSVEQKEPEVLIENPEEKTEEVQMVFVPHTLQTKVDMSILEDYESLLKNFYTIDTCAMVGSNLLDARLLADVDLRITKNTDEPQILIYHTHSQEGFADSVPGDDSTTIVGVGEHLANILREEYGYQVIHHLGKYDEETRNNAYSRALPDIVQVLQDNPTIEVVIDLHRDAVNENTRLVTDIDGRPTARFMFFNGVSCTKNTGSISYLENEYQKENLAFSFQMKKAAEEYYPGLTRKNYIHGYRYNMHLLPRTTLIELGAQNNTLEEAMNACYPIAHILDMVLTGA